MSEQEGVMKNRNYLEAKAYFDKRNYEMTVLHDEGLHRCLKFMHEKKHDGHFVITTWPGHLCISGDMGTYVFSRITDMMDFFVDEGINPTYWSEKLQAESLFGGGYQEFSIELFKEQIQELKETLLEFRSDDREEIEDAFEASEFVEDEYDAVTFVRDLQSAGYENYELTFPDVFTFHYLFACVAINYACNTYHAYKHDQNNVAAENAELNEASQ